jgi:hypothetical protein
VFGELGALPKIREEIVSELQMVFKFFLATIQIAIFSPKLIPALFLKNPRHPCPFEILAEALAP